MLSRIVLGFGSLCVLLGILLPMVSLLHCGMVLLCLYLLVGCIMV